MKTRERLFLFLSVFLLVLDLITKHWAYSAGVAELNTGISFGLGLGLSWWLVQIVVLCVLAFLWQHTSQKARGPLMLILSGGLGNVLSRVVWGGVVDWLPLPWSGKNNIADWCIAIGLVWWFLIQYQRESRTPAPPRPV